MNQKTALWPHFLFFSNFPNKSNRWNFWIWLLKIVYPRLTFGKISGIRQMGRWPPILDPYRQPLLRTRSSEHITPVLRQLHWLPIKQLIAYKILLLTYKAMNGMAPKYIVDLLERFTPKSQLRSSSNNINLLVIQKSNLKSFRDTPFRVAAPRLWNVLPNRTRLIQYLNVFLKK